MKKYLIAIIFVISLIAPFKAFAREKVDYWYIKSFDSHITINQNSSLTIDEKITADCGECIGKHGIYRILPTVYSPEKGKNENLHIKLISISDFAGNPLTYETLTNRSDNTITWKIGDPNKTVQGVNEYEIKYQVENGIRGSNASFDEFYWNLNGNFWDIETDEFNAYVKFPNGVNRSNTTLNLYAGAFGDNTSGVADFSWVDDTTLKVSSLRALYPGEGITLSATFPKSLVTLYEPKFLEKYGYILTFLLPVLILLLCLYLWLKYGNDPAINDTVVPEFEIPEGMSPMSLGMVYTDGILKNHYISATIVNLAVKKAIKIEEIPKKGVFGNIDFKLSRLNSGKDLTKDEKNLIDRLFGSNAEIKISDFKNDFYTKIPGISSGVKNELVLKQYLFAGSRTLQYAFIFFALALFGSSFAVGAFSSYLAVNMIVSAVIIFIFSFLMPKRTRAGAEFNLRVKGLKLYIETAEKYRQKFNEKENIFERFLPYAMMFGMTKLWIEKMKAIYGQDYFDHYVPYWYAGSIAHFNAENFGSAISAMSSNMSSTISSSPSSSGSGGGGFSGGGGGGGGGGGW